MLGGTRGKLAAQITDVADQLGSGLTALIGLALVAVALAAGALLVAVRAVSAARS